MTRHVTQSEKTRMWTTRNTPTGQFSRERRAERLSCTCRDDWSGFCDLHDALEVVDLAPVREEVDQW